MATGSRRLAAVVVAACLAVLAAGCGSAHPKGPAGRVAPLSDTAATTYRVDAAQRAVGGDDVPPPLARQWHRDVLLDAPPLVADRVVFAILREGATDDRRLVAIALRSGATLWSRSVRDVPSELGLDAGSVYVLDQEGRLAAYATGTGRRSWSRNLATGTAYTFSEAPTVSGGRVVLVAGGINATVFSLSARSGRTLWTTGVNGSAAIAAVARGTVYLDLAGPQLYALRADTGAVRWHRGGFPHGGGYSTPTVVGRRVFLPDVTGLVLTRDGRTRDVFASQRWLATNGSILVTDIRDGVLQGQRLPDLSHLWLAPAPDGAAFRPHYVISGGVVYASDGVAVRALRLSDGHEVWSAPERDVVGLTEAGNRLIAWGDGGVSAYAH